MLYRLRPPMVLEWSGFPGFDTFETAREHQLDFDRLDWKPTESLVFSQDVLRIAVRHGVTSSTGLILDAQHTIDLARADELRVLNMQMDTVQADQRAQAGSRMERVLPGWATAGEQLDADVRKGTEREARKATADLKATLATPAREDLTQHWTRLGGSLGD